jgi:hypothetical protein
MDKVGDSSVVTDLTPLPHSRARHSNAQPAEVNVPARLSANPNSNAGCNLRLTDTEFDD